MPKCRHASRRRPAAAARGGFRRRDRADAVLQRDRRRRQRALRRGDLCAHAGPGRGDDGLRPAARRRARGAGDRRHRRDPRHAVPAGSHRGRVDAGGVRGVGADSAGHPAGVDLHRRVRARRGRPARRAPGDHALEIRRLDAPPASRGAARRERVVRRRRRRAHVGGPCRRNRLVPAHHSLGSRRAGGQRGRQVLRRPAVAGGWPGAVHRPAGACAGSLLHCRDAGVGAAAPRRGAHGAAVGPAREV